MLGYPIPPMTKTRCAKISFAVELFKVSVVEEHVNGTFRLQCFV
jgi:hypothetical protein